MPVAASYFVGLVNGEPVCHLAVAPKFQSAAYRATRLVVMPEWQGAGVGTRFLEYVCQYHLEGNGVKGHRYPTMFHTSHPQLVGYLRRSDRWVLKSQQLYGGNKASSRKSVVGASVGASWHGGSGYGGHFRSVQGFKYVGDGHRSN